MRTIVTTLVVALGFPVLAAAQDACLTGASTLGDQRAFAALRTSTQSACPCASFTKRSAYQKCARAAIEGAIGDGDLRIECFKTALKIEKGAVCGSTKIACGRYAPTSKHPLTCKLKAPGRCVDTAKIDSTPCTAETHCADVVDWTASTCIDPRENATAFVPGVRVVTFTKTSVAKYCTGGTGNCGTQPYGDGCACTTNAACQSGVCEQQSRPLDTTIWYPAAPGSSPIDPSYGAVLNAPLDPSGGPYPLLMFSHGSCGYPEQSIFLTARLASYGFVVAAPPHPGNTIYDFPYCGIGPSLGASVQERPQDVIFALDGVLAESADVGSPLYGAVDDTRIGMSGHSFGGLTTYLVLPLEPRFKTAMPLAPAVFGTPMVTIPSLMMIAEVDSYVNNTAVRAAYDDATSPKYLVEILHAGHFAFSNGCFPSSDCNPPTTLTQPESHDLVLRYAVPFLQAYLAGDAGFLPFFIPPANPGVVLEAAP
ncbi:MAG TPA: prolyl oligopeptidase family serine peptidase [Candidatus Binatia bacterium]|nr:prolyl oligopeptidase family serine peptidase [Candidatus Binatia bacterium]